MIFCFTNFFLLAILTAALYTDFKYRKIPNHLILTGMSIGGFLATWQLLHKLRGKDLVFQLLQNISGFLFLFCLIYCLYQLHALGAGDCKLLLLLNLFFSIKTTLICLMLALLLGALIGIFKMIITKEKNLGTIHFALPVWLGAIGIMLFTQIR